MLRIRSNELSLLRDLKTTLEKNKGLFKGNEKEPVLRFLQYMDELEIRYAEDKTAQAKAMREFRTNPATKEKAKANDRKALAKFRSKGKDKK